MTERPMLSILVIGYKMSRQLANTLYTLSPAYQRGVDGSEYEVVVVENSSPDPLDAAILDRLGVDYQYRYREEPGVSPTPALNEAFRMSRGRFVGIMIDGARMLTPGVLRNALDVFAMAPDAVVATLGFHLGPRDQQELHLAGYDAAHEIALLDGLPQHGDGYRLFDISCLSLANPHGFLHPMMESNCMFVRREHWEAVGGADERFDQVGGGMLNLDLYRELVELPDTSLFTLPGEGSFHQFHGGVTTQRDESREQLMQQFQRRYEEIRGKVFRSPIKEPQWYGEIPDNALPVLYASANKGIERWFQRTKLDEPVWRDEVTAPRDSPELTAEFRHREAGYRVPDHVRRLLATPTLPPEPPATPTASKSPQPRLSDGLRTRLLRRTGWRRATRLRVRASKAD